VIRITKEVKLKLSISDCDSFGLKPISWFSGDDLAGSHVKLTGRIGKRRTVVVDMAKERGAVAALDLGPLPLNSPVVDGFEEGANLVLLLELELGCVYGGEGDGVLVSGLKVEVRGEGVGGVEIEVGAARRAGVRRGHDRQWCEERGFEGAGGRRTRCLRKVQSVWLWKKDTRCDCFIAEVKLFLIFKSNFADHIRQYSITYNKKKCLTNGNGKVIKRRNNIHLQNNYTLYFIFYLK